jgi:transposase-like protein
MTKEKKKRIKQETYSITQFRKDYPNEKACLDKIFQIRFGRLGACPICGVINAKFKKILTRRCYQCSDCGYQLHPTAGTIFEKTRTPLTYWFYAIYLYTVTRNGVAAKELERQLKVTYKTAWRMAHQIRKIMTNQSTEILTGIIIADETFIGGQERNKHKSKRKNIDGYVGKIAVFGMMDDKGRVITHVLDGNPNGKVLKPIIREQVHKDSTIVSDGFGGYAGLKKEFKDHQVVNHESGEYVNEAGHSTNALESHWSGLKRMIKGTHIHVGRKHLPKYLAENIFRFENKHQPEKMFELILQKIA